METLKDMTTLKIFTILHLFKINSNSSRDAVRNTTAVRSISDFSGPEFVEVQEWLELFQNKVSVHQTQWLCDENFNEH